MKAQAFKIPTCLKGWKQKNEENFCYAKTGTVAIHYGVTKSLSCFALLPYYAFLILLSSIWPNWFLPPKPLLSTILFSTWHKSIITLFSLLFWCRLAYLPSFGVYLAFFLLWFCWGLGCLVLSLCYTCGQLSLCVTVGACCGMLSSSLKALQAYLTE